MGVMVGLCEAGPLGVFIFQISLHLVSSNESITFKFSYHSLVPVSCDSLFSPACPNFWPVVCL